MQSVLHLVSGDESEQETTLTIAKNLLEDESGDIDDVAVVAQAGGIEAITSDGGFTEEVESLAENGASFKACANTLEMEGIDESELLGNAETVPEGAVEVTRLENEGYAYMRP
ncbi:DsrE family protein [Halosimplex aquaticum]|uniref:DsrE family protein n=1 Tax=Halosimplex aquaticum TaxID=3026162 RepID=A0ABD5XWA2_9EURY|nr:DsrE family protein [Halosimplex aquaticum]